MKFFLPLYITFSFATTDPNFFSSSLIDLEQIIEESKAETIYKSKQHILTPSAIAALTDKQNLITDDFAIPDYFHDSVYFWFSIYTQYSSKQVVIHDKDDLSIIYRVLDFNEVHESDLNIFTKYKVQNQLAQENVVAIKKAFQKLIKGESSEDANNLVKILTSNKVELPKNPKKRRSLLKKLSSNLRTQTGQKNMIYQGIINAELYLDFLENTMQLFNIPTELVGIAFLESSFNYKAESRVGASGIWQFMPFIANLFMPQITDTVDYRSNPVISSISAFHLLKQNKRILKKWDLAVTAYNSGTKHLVKARRKFKKVGDVDLAYILQNYNHPHLGFASQNFYSEFLALVHTLKYRKTFFSIEGKIQNKTFNSNDLQVYVARCKFKPSYLDKKYSKNITSLNPQFKKVNSLYSSAHLIVSDKELPNSYFYKVPTKTVVKEYPKKWKKGVRLKNCRLL